MERWKRLEGIWSEFEVSDEGRVKKNGELKRYKPNNHGHISLQKVVNFEKHQVLLHRAIWTAFNGDPDEFEVDHRNRNRTDNRLENLRLVTHQQQGLNKSKSKSATGSKYLGVHRNKKGYQGQVRKDGKLYSVTAYPCDTKAALERDKLAVQLHGPHYIALNFPQLFFSNDRSAIVGQ